MPGERLLGFGMEEVLAKLLGGDLIGRFAEELAEFENAGPVAQDAALGQREQAQIVEEAV